MKYDGENSMLIPGASPICHDVCCDHCKGKGTVEVENEATESWDEITCPVCKGEKTLEACR